MQGRVCRAVSREGTEWEHVSGKGCTFQSSSKLQREEKRMCYDAISMHNQIQQRAAVLDGQARADGEGAELLHGHAVAHVAWHGRGDYFASVAPTGNTQARSPGSWHLV